MTETQIVLTHVLESSVIVPEALIKASVTACHTNQERKAVGVALKGSDSD